MTLEASVAFTNAIALETVKIAELYIIELRTGSIFYYTSHSRDIIWDATPHTYVSLPITRSPISSNVNLEADAVSIQLANISGDLYDLVQANILDSAKITIKRILWTETYADQMEITLFVGTADITFDRAILVLKCRSILNSLNIQVPREIYQEPCNFTLYDDGCSLVRADFKYSGSATANGGDNFTIIDTDLVVYKVDFDNGDEDNPVEIGDALTGDSGGDGECINIVYLTASTGTIWYVENTQQFVDDEVITGGGNTVDVNGTPAEDTTFYEKGEIEITSGDNDGERRMIILSSSGTITVAVAFPNEVLSAVTYDVYPGCDKRAEATCQNKYNNSDNFNGYLYVPKVQETIM